MTPALLAPTKEVALQFNMQTFFSRWLLSTQWVWKGSQAWPPQSTVSGWGSGESSRQLKGALNTLYSR